MEKSDEDSKSEYEARTKLEKIVAEELGEILARTPVERVWKSFEKVGEKWEMEATVAAKRERKDQEERRRLRKELSWRGWKERVDWRKREWLR